MKNSNWKLMPLLLTIQSVALSQVGVLRASQQPRSIPTNDGLDVSTKTESPLALHKTEIKQYIHICTYKSTLKSNPSIVNRFCVCVCVCYQTNTPEVICFTVSVRVFCCLSSLKGGPSLNNCTNVTLLRHICPKRTQKDI